MLQEPHQFGRLTVGDFGRARFHRGDGFEVGHRRGLDSPFDIGAAGRPREGRQIKALAVINHWLTITWSVQTQQI